MRQVTLVIPAAISHEIRDALAQPKETGGVLLVGIAQASDGALRLLGREIHLLGSDDYATRSAKELLVPSDAYVRELSRAQTIGATPLWFHTHPGVDASAVRSERDELVDEQLAETFRIRSDSELYGSLIVAGDPTAIRFGGRVRGCGGDVGGGEAEITRLWEIGSRLRLTRADGQRANPAARGDLYDRNVRAFGGPIQDVLSNLRVAVVGCGGTGSAVAEQLTRIGVRNLVLFDPDTLSRSNLTRVYGSTPGDVGSNKASVLAKHLSTIAPDAVIREIGEPITNERAARELIGCDVVYGCTDDNAGRLVLSRLATYVMSVVIDCGVLISSDGAGKLTGIDGA